MTEDVKEALLKNAANTGDNAVFEEVLDEISMAENEEIEVAANGGEDFDDDSLDYDPEDDDGTINGRRCGF